MSESVGGLSLQPLQPLLEAVAARTTAPGAGVVAGAVAALAGALTGMCARFSGGDQADLTGRADELGARATSLAKSDLGVYAAYLHARRAGSDRDIAAALDETIRVPLEIAEVAAELAELAASLARSGNPNLRADATAAALMGSAAARATAVLVCENLAGIGHDHRHARAAALVASVNAVETEVLSRYPALTAQ